MSADSIPGQLAQACAQVRPAEPADEVAGVQPGLVAAPATTQEASAVLRAAAELGLTVIPRGSGTKLHWGNPPEKCDLILDTIGLNQVVEHAAGDLVATVQAGVSLEQLAGVLARAGQRLALDPAVSELPSAATRGTVGGVLATNTAGPLRLRYGAPRDLLIGITIVRADGTIAKSGGKVVKNVAGYDLGKLFAGSRGTLGLIAQATFRLHPLPPATAYVLAERSAQDCAPLLSAALEAALAPVAAELHWPDPAEPVELAIALEGDPAGVTERATALARATGGTVAESPPSWWGTGPVAGTRLQLAFWPGRLRSVLTELAAASRQTGLTPAVGGSAGAGLLDAALPAEADPEQLAAFVATLRRSLGHVAASGSPPRASVVVQHAPAPVRERLDLFGPVPSLALMRSVKQQFDPERLLSPGRFAGGI
jgi:glycolate dehydrogenase FAD-binding subunit